MVNGEDGSGELKVLGILHMFFRLPSDFEGDLSAALRLLADYHDGAKEGALTPVEHDPTKMTAQEFWELRFQEFWAAQTRDKRVLGDVILSRLDAETGETLEELAL